MPSAVPPALGGACARSHACLHSQSCSAALTLSSHAQRRWRSKPISSGLPVLCAVSKPWVTTTCKWRCSAPAYQQAAHLLVCMSMVLHFNGAPFPASPHLIALHQVGHRAHACGVEARYKGTVQRVREGEGGTGPPNDAKAHASALLNAMTQCRHPPPPPGKQRCEGSPNPSGAAGNPRCWRAYYHWACGQRTLPARQRSAAASQLNAQCALFAAAPFPLPTPHRQAPRGKHGTRRPCSKQPARSCRSGRWR